MCHVLIIEDEPFIALHLQTMLEQNGATSFDFAATEDEAVERAAARAPELITSDVNLIEGTGPCAVARILASCGPTPVMFVTATPAACEPCDDAIILSKPVNQRQFAAAFRSLLPTPAG